MAWVNWSRKSQDASATRRSRPSETQRDRGCANAHLIARDDETDRWRDCLRSHDRKDLAHGVIEI